MTNKKSFLETILCCPKCKGDLVYSADTSQCRLCHSEFPIKNGKYYFIDINHDDELNDGLDIVKHAVKRFRALYYLSIMLLSPVLYNGYHKKILKKLDGFIINVGSGNSVIGDNVINVDMFDYEYVTVVADIQRLPFKSSSLDGVFNIAVLEHVQEPVRVIEESFRVLKDGGVIFSVVPFMQPFHASPHDYYRTSRSGIKFLHRDYNEIDVGVYGGPVSGFLWVFQEFLALILSFGIKPLRDFLYLMVMVLTWPLKFLDVFFKKLPTADNIASTFYFYGKKVVDHAPKSNKHNIK